MRIVLRDGWVGRCGRGRVRGVEGDSVMGCGFFFQAEDGVRVAQESRGLGDVYKRQL